MANVIYRDNLIEIEPDAIVFKRYYFPFGSRRVLFSAIERAEMRPNNTLQGKYRLWGSGDLRTWFPLDWQRPARSKLFLLTLRGRWWHIGFSVEDAERVEALLRERGVLR